MSPRAGLRTFQPPRSEIEYFEIGEVRVLGYFCAIKTKKFMFSVWGSPLPGPACTWTCSRTARGPGRIVAPAGRALQGRAHCIL